MITAKLTICRPEIMRDKTETLIPHSWATWLAVMSFRCSHSSNFITPPLYRRIKIAETAKYGNLNSA